MQTSQLSIRLLDLLVGDEPEDAQEINHQLAEFGLGCEIKILDEVHHPARPLRIPPLSRLQVTSKLDGESIDASALLDMLWRRDGHGLNDRDEVLEKIKRVGFKPFEPVIVSEFGDTIDIQEWSKRSDATSLYHYCIHAHCRGEIELRQISNTHIAIICRVCQMRIPIPDSVETLGKLRAHFGHLQR